MGKKVVIVWFTHTCGHDAYCQVREESLLLQSWQYFLSCFHLKASLDSIYYFIPIRIKLLRLEFSPNDHWTSNVYLPLPSWWTMPFSTALNSLNFSWIAMTVSAMHCGVIMPKDASWDKCSKKLRYKFSDHIFSENSSIKSLRQYLEFSRSSLAIDTIKVPYEFINRVVLHHLSFGKAWVDGRMNVPEKHELFLSRIYIYEVVKQTLK